MIRRFILKYIFGVYLLIGMTCSGCIGYIPLNMADPATRQNVNEEMILSITPGQTTRQEILLKLGEPDESSFYGTELTYDWSRIKGIAWIYFGMPVGTNIAEKSRLIIYFDDKGVVSRTKSEKKVKYFNQ